MSATDSSTARSAFTVSQIITLVIGIAFTASGIAGFFITGFSGFFSSTATDTLVGFRINPIHNCVHLLLGLVGIALFRTEFRARIYGWILFAGYGIAFVYGLFTANNNSALNFLSLNGPDNGLHLTATLAGLVAALIPTSVGKGLTTGTTPR